MHWLLLFVTITAVLLTNYAIWNRVRDPLHPVFVLTVPLFGLYVAQPTLLVLTDYQDLMRLLSQHQVDTVLTINFAGVCAILAGAKGPKRVAHFIRRETFATDTARLWWLGIALGSVAAASYLYCIWAVGGFREAYGRNYGGGWSDLGYVREAVWLAVPGIVFIALARRVLRWRDLAIIAAITSPLLVHGILGARRGPTAAACLTLALSRYVATGARPSLKQLFTGLACLGVLLLFLVANREAIYLGSDEQLAGGVSSYATSAETGNEFVYGSAVVLASRDENKHYFGRRYLTVVFIRPIPHQWFPKKYAFAAEYLGIPNLARHGSNLGTGDLHFRSVVGWQPPIGAAPGLIADLWLEFSYGYVLALWAIGRFYWIGWHRAITGNRFWMIAYIIMIAMSFYLIAQTLEAMLFRFLLAAGAVIGTWAFVEGKLPSFGRGRHSPPRYSDSRHSEHM